MATVLVVDDELDIAKAYAKWLEDDHEVEVATSVRPGDVRFVVDNENCCHFLSETQPTDRH